MAQQNIEDSVLDYLAQIQNPFSLDDLFKATGIKKNQKKVSEINQLILTIDEFVKDDHLFYPKITFLEKFPIRILPTKLEIENNILIPGHRLLPFHPTGAVVDDISFQYNSSLLETKKFSLKLMELRIFFSLMDLQKIPVINIEDILDENADLTIEVCDLGDFYKKHNFQPGDTIIARSKDFNSGVFSIQYESIDDFDRNIFEIEKRDKLFINALKSVVSQDLNYPNVEKQLLYTYYHLKKDYPLPNPWERPGSALGPMLRKFDDLTFSPLPNGRTIFHFVDQTLDDLSLYPEFDEILDNVDDDEEFDLETIDGILKFLNNNNSINVVRALLFDQLTKRKRFSYKDIEDYLFDGLPKPYMPKELQQIMRKLVSDQYKQLKKSFDLKYAFLPTTTAREKILQLSLEISRFLRFLDEEMVELDDLPKNEMMHLMELDRAFDEILAELEELQLNGSKDNSEVHRVLKIIDRVSTELPGLFASISEKLEL
jgi:hypothetical protein